MIYVFRVFSVICAIVCNFFFSFVLCAKKKNVAPPLHDCPLNYETGSSKAMEPDAILHIVKSYLEPQEGKKWGSELLETFPKKMRGRFFPPSFSDSRQCALYYNDRSQV